MVTINQTVDFAVKQTEEAIHRIIKEVYAEEINKAKLDLINEFKDIIRECIKKGLAVELIDIEAIPHLMVKHKLYNKLVNEAKE